MSLPKKGARKLVIDDKTYLWYIRKKPTYMQEVFCCSWSMAVELAELNGAVLLVNFVISRPDNLISPHQTSVTPTLVKRIINQAIQSGWQPELSGSAYQFNYALIKDGINPV